MRASNATYEQTASMLETYTDFGVDAIMGPLSAPSLNNFPDLLGTLNRFEGETGRKIIKIDTPVMNVDDTKEGRASAAATIKASAASGAKFCLIHHSSAEQLVNKNKRVIERLPDYLKMIRDNGMIPGLSAHMPELIMFSDLNGYDVQTYIQIFNCLGFLMQIEIESIIHIIHGAKKPVMTIKPMAAGRMTPYVGLTFNWNVLRACDMITVGCQNRHEAFEAVEISFAALEKRLPNLEGRSSPNKTDLIKGGANK